MEIVLTLDIYSLAIDGEALIKFASCVAHQATLSSLLNSFPCRKMHCGFGMDMSHPRPYGKWISTYMSHRSNKVQIVRF